MELGPVEARILGCLLEKARTTPDQYPLSLNALVGACNQSTNRAPVVTYDAEIVEAGLDDLRARELVRREKPHGGRAIKYSELLARVLPMGKPELALIAVLLLRGPQTPGELKARSERLYSFAHLDSVDETLARLVRHQDGPLVRQLARESGRKESRWQELLSAGPVAPGGVAEGVTDPGDPTDVPEVTGAGLLTDRVAYLEAEVERLATLLDGLAADPRD